MRIKKERIYSFQARLLQILISLIPFSVGVTALLNNIQFYQSSLHRVVIPLITMYGIDSALQWRALPLNPHFVFTVIIASEFFIGILAFIGILVMLFRFNADESLFERAKAWVYAACGWGIFVFGLGFFELTQDWFSSGDNPQLKMLQPDGLSYSMMLFIVFVYLKLSYRK